MSLEVQSKNLQAIRGTQIIGKDSSYSILKHKYVITVVAGPDKDKRFEVNKTHILIGTNENCDIVLKDPTVSRKHCEIFIRDGDYVIRDLDSTNGTYINGLRIVEAYLPIGATITLGHTVIIFQPKKSWVSVQPSSKESFGSLLGKSYRMKEIFGILEKISPTDLSVIITGETGTGKELAAKAIHQHSSRKDKPFIVVDCSAIPPTLIEAELFGFERGAFTGAYRSKPGAFELANGGTIFLDEIGELPLEVQPKFLRVLEQKEVRRLGSNKIINVDVRIISATNKNLEEEIKNGNFRKDLFYRLSEVVIELPPLRKRKEDIPFLLEYFLKRERGGEPPKLTDRLLNYLLRQPWYGNVRELENFAKRLSIMVKKPIIDLDDIPKEILNFEKEPISSKDKSGLFTYLPIKEARERWLAPKEREYLIHLIKQCGGDMNQVSQIAGLHRKSIERLMRKYNIRLEDIL